MYLSACQAAACGVVVLLMCRKMWSVMVAVKSPLSEIPGPWYASLTATHLRYGFATGEVWKMVESAHRKYGPIVRLGPRQVWISDKEAMKQILVSVDLPKVAMYAEISRDRYNPGLFGEIRPDAHRKLKKFLSPAFTVAYIDRLELLFIQCISDLLSKYETILDASTQPIKENGVEIDMMNDLHSVALDIMGECSFGKGFGQTNPNREAIEGVEETIWRSIPRAIFDGLAKRYKNVYFKRFFRSLGIDIQFDWPAQMIQAIDKIVQGRQNSQGGFRPDLLQHLIDEGRSPSSDTRMTTRQIVDQMSEILLAGSETTSGTIACLFLELAQNPQVKAKLLASLPVRGRNDEIIVSSESRNGKQYEYLNACIKENLRLHPIASEMGRRTGNKWLTILGYDLPPHTVVSASYRDLHRNGEYWPEPLRFWPERWLGSGARDGAPEPDMSAYFPFSAGKHSCIGINFAWAEMRMVAANFFSRFDLIDIPGQHVDFRQFITMQFKTGSWKAMIKHRIDAI